MTEERKLEFEIEMVPVESSQIVAIGYRQDDETLFVNFKGGSVYSYRNVGSQLHECLMRADSKGKYFGEQIKKHPEQFPFLRLRDLRDTDRQEAAKLEKGVSRTDHGGQP